MGNNPIAMIDPDGGQVPTGCVYGAIKTFSWLGLAGGIAGSSVSNFLKNERSPNLSNMETQRYTIEMQRIAESPNATVSEFTAYGPVPLKPITGYFLEPGGPSTTKSGLDRRIPAGTYNMKWTYSKHFKTYMYLISNLEVSADRGIRMHKGNYHFETGGCLLPGSSYGVINGNYSVSNSKNTYTSLMQLLNTNKTTLIINDINP
jgi:hypothetical protein